MRQELRIVVEGMDGSGKTTLINHLQERFPQLELVRNSLGPEQTFEEFWPAQLDKENSNIVPIHDRFFYSELVYGPVLRGKINAEPALIQNTVWFLRSLAMLIYARPHSDKLREGVKKQEQMEGVHDHFTELLELYDQVMATEMSWYGNRFIQYTWANESQVVEQVAGYLDGVVR